MKTKVLSIVQSFPENIVTLSRFRGFIAHPNYDYRVYCWKSDSKSWNLWAPDLQKSARKKVLLAGVSRLKSIGFLPEILRFIYFLLRKPALAYRHFRLLYPQVGFTRTCYRLLDDYKILSAQPDILHFEYGALAVSKMYLKPLLHCKVVVSFRGYDLNYFQLGNDSIFQPVWEQADGIHFLGKDLLERAKRRGFPGNPCIRLIPPAIDLEHFKPSNRPVKAVNEGIQVVSVCRLTWKKGLQFGLLAFADFIKKGGQGVYHIIGDGPALEELRFYVYELGISPQVCFQGQYSPLQVRDLLNESDVFLHPAISEGFCNAALEAQAMKLPVVCFAADGLSENIAEGQTGFISPLWDWQKMAQQLLYLWENPQKRLEMGESGRQRIQDHFRLDQQMAAFDEFYQQVRRGQ